jgi:hypothetical protein
MIKDVFGYVLSDHLCRAILTILDEISDVIAETALLSEAALSR